MTKRETWERIKRYPILADTVKRHIAVFGKPQAVRLKEI